MFIKTVVEGIAKYLWLVNQMQVKTDAHLAQMILGTGTSHATGCAMMAAALPASKVLPGSREAQSRMFLSAGAME